MTTPQKIQSRITIHELQEAGLLKAYCKAQVIKKYIQGVNPTPAQNREALNRHLSSLGLDSEEARLAYTQKHDLDINSITEEATKSLRIKASAKSLFNDSVSDMFATKRLDLSSVTYGLIRSKGEDLCRELYLQIESGENCFYETAGLHSEGPERERMGIVGPVSLTQGNQKLTKILLSLEIGELSQPHRIGEFWVIVKLIKRHDAILDEATHELLCTNLFNNMIEKEANALVQSYLQPMEGV